MTRILTDEELQAARAAKRAAEEEAAAKALADRLNDEAARLAEQERALEALEEENVKLKELVKELSPKEE